MEEVSTHTHTGVHTRSNERVMTASHVCMRTISVLRRLGQDEITDQPGLHSKSLQKEKKRKGEREEERREGMTEREERKREGEREGERKEERGRKRRGGKG